MKHDIAAEGEVFRLRPVSLDDADFIVGLRTDPRLGRYVNRGAETAEQQRDWLRRYFERPGDYYFVVERKGGGAEGLVSIYDVEMGCAEWGRWVLRHGSLAAPESAYLVYGTAFEQLGLNEIYCRTLEDNVSVLSFHDGCGLMRRRQIPSHTEIDGRAYSAVEHVAFAKDWPGKFADLCEHTRKVAKLLNRQ